jgi:hypothetical protein
MNFCECIPKQVIIRLSISQLLERSVLIKRVRCQGMTYTLTFGSFDSFLFTHSIPRLRYYSRKLLHWVDVVKRDF